MNTNTAQKPACIKVCMWGVSITGTVVLGENLNHELCFVTFKNDSFNASDEIPIFILREYEANSIPISIFNITIKLCIATDI